MKTRIQNIYTAAELKAHDPRAFERALEKYRERIGQEDYSSDELLASLQALCDAAGVRMKDYSLGAYNRGNRLRVEFSQDEAGDLTGARALAWVENNLLAPLRVPWSGPKRWELARYGAFYRPGLVKPCPLTGVCYDEDFIEALIKAIKSGDTLKDAFQGLESDFARILESEYEYQAREDQFLETAESNGWEFTEDGRII